MIPARISLSGLLLCILGCDRVILHISLRGTAHREDMTDMVLLTEDPLPLTAWA